MYLYYLARFNYDLDHYHSCLMYSTMYLTMFYYVFRPLAILPTNAHVFDYVSVKNDYVLLCNDS